jgi:membrane-associated protease RseP (regulator of RpoE activity)
MEILLVFLLLSLFAYFLVKNNAKGRTETPIWLLWLVMIAPALIWTIWILIFGEKTPIPPILVFLPVFLCPFIYWWLIDLGQPKSTLKNTPEKPQLNLEETNFLPKQIQSKPITNSEEDELKNCFPWGVFYLQNIDYRPQAILCRGKLRVAGEIAYQKIQKNVEQVFGDRFILLLQESLQGQPFFALVPNPWAKGKNEEIEPINKPIYVLSLLFITLFTTTLIGTEISGISLEAIQKDSSLLINGLPYSLGLICILGVHELSHYFTAINYKIKTSLPYFIPIPFFLGTFGAFISMRSPVPHRKALFDIGIAGPIGGLIVTIPLLIWGLSLSEIAPLTDKASLLTFDALNPRFSLLLTLLTKLAMGSKFVAETAINLHPLAVAGYLGLIITALNLMPIGSLDGGHIVHAMFGQKNAVIIGQITRLLMFILAFSQGDFLLWAIILLLMPITDQPALNDVTELDNKRDFLGLASLVILALILLPIPGAIANLLNI